jgi:hypothetical protein
MSEKAERKRPWYLALALVGGLALGLGQGCDGYLDMSFYRSERLDPSAIVQSVSNDADRITIQKRFDAWVVAMDAAKTRVFPLGVAALVLGMATIIFAMRAMAGRKSARSALIQLVIAQAALGGASFALRTDDRRAYNDLAAAVATSRARAMAPDPAQADSVARITVAAQSVMPPVYLALRTLACALIVFAITRPRAREFFDAASDPVSEQ